LLTNIRKNYFTNIRIIIVRQGEQMAYNEKIGRAIATFDSTVKKAGFSSDAERKILSILRSMEYQVEMGECPPVPAIQHLQAAIQAWIKADGQDRKGLMMSLDRCVAIVLKEVGDAEQSNAG